MIEGGGEAQAAVASDSRRWGDRQRWEVMGGGGEAQVAVGKDRRRWGGTGSGGK